MKIISILFLLQCEAININFLQFFLSGNPMIYNLTEPRSAIADSLNALRRIQLTNYQKKVLWNIYKGDDNPEQLTADDLRNISGILDGIPEDDLAQLNVSNWDVVEILGQIKTFSRPQVSVIVDSLKSKWGTLQLTQAHTINKLSSLLCGFSEEDLTKTSKHEFAKIHPQVLANLYACGDRQLRLLLELAVKIYGQPKTWSKEITSDLGMLILALDNDELRSLRPSALNGLNIQMITEMKPQIIKTLTHGQLASLNSLSKMFIHQNLSLLKSYSYPLQFQATLLVFWLAPHAYLLLKF